VPVPEIKRDAGFVDQGRKGRKSAGPARSPRGQDLSGRRGEDQEGPGMDMSEDCWEHAGLLQDVAAEPPPPPVAPDFLIQQQEVSPAFSSTAR
jgi:hypothetical protein